MRGIRSAVLIGLACCIGATGAFARQTSSHSKSTRAEKSTRASKTKKTRAASTKSKKSKARQASAKSRKKHEARGKRTGDAIRSTAAYRDLPPEELPAEELDDEATNNEPR